MSSEKTAPGKLRFQCMIWEPQPIKQRRQQEDEFVYNPLTLRLLKNLPENLRLFGGEPASICLKEKYVYRDTFLKINDEWLQPSSVDARGFKGENLFDNNGIPTIPWMYHQTFKFNGSLFDNRVVAPSAVTDGTNPDSFDPGIAQWNYNWLDVPFDTNGVAQVNGGDGDGGEDDFSDNGTVDPQWSATRRNLRLAPWQVRATSEFRQNATSSSSSAPKPKPIHWLALKETPLARKEDFFVEFFRMAYRPDTVSSDATMLSQYAPIDTATEPDTGSGTVPDTSLPLIRNLAMVSFRKDGSIDPDTRDTLSLAKQPYYVVEIGHGDENHNYWIILAYNHKPIFVQVGKMAIDLPGVTADDPDANIPNTVVQPEINCSRLLSTYDVSCKELMDKDSCRITVRNHMGRIVIMFQGHEDNPWVIDRWDYNIDDAFTAQASNTPVTQRLEISQSRVYMMVPPKPIQIGAGNLMCGFTFAPLTYWSSASMPAPQPIAVRGPVDQNSLNLLLCEKHTRSLDGVTGTPKDIPSEKDNKGQAVKPTSSYVPVYFQEAEVYGELIDGKPVVIARKDRLDRTVPQESPTGESELFWQANYGGPDSKDVTPQDNQGSVGFQPTSSDGNLSYIRIVQQSALTGVPQTDTPTDTQDTATVPDAGTKYFGATYELGAGDMVVGKGDSEKEWYIANAITPIGTGWRLYVPQSAQTHSVCPVDCAHHVQRVSLNSSFTDNLRIDHSGSIVFHIPFGKMTGIGNAGQNNDQNNNDSCNDPPTGSDAYQIDQSQFLMNLVDKTFFIRLYASWEGGFMDCANGGCPCRQVAQLGAGGNPNIIFTGLCHGGSITVENNKRYMECQLLDYWKILEDSQFLNSPFFDGMRDFNAVYEIMKIAGFSDEIDNVSKRKADVYPPASFIKQCANAQKQSFWVVSTGEKFFQQDFGLPASYEILQSPVLKFQDGSKLAEAITKIAAYSGKIVYFDRYGIFRMVMRPDQRACNASTLAPKCNFYASPFDIPGDAKTCQQYDSLVLNSYTFKRVVADVYNEIQVVSNTPEGELIIGSGVNLAGKFDPSKPGYIGYTKRLLQMEGAFGSQEAVDKIVGYYSGIFNPPIVVNWESYGIGKLLAGDLVTFSGLWYDESFPSQNLAGGDQPRKTALLYLTSLSCDIDPQRNEWKNKYEGEWIFYGQSGCEIGGTAS